MPRKLIKTWIEIEDKGYVRGKRLETFDEMIDRLINKAKKAGRKDARKAIREINQMALTAKAKFRQHGDFGRSPLSTVFDLPFFDDQVRKAIDPPLIQGSLGRLKRMRFFQG